VISHRPAALELADRVMTLGTANLGAPEREGSTLGRSQR
jgi:hypothetical protein